MGVNERGSRKSEVSGYHRAPHKRGSEAQRASQGQNSKEPWCVRMDWCHLQPMNFHFQNFLSKDAIVQV